MKIKCDFCKTEYNLDKAPSGSVKCAVCGNVWTVQKNNKKNSFLIFFAALCALLAAMVFAVVVFVNYQVTKIKNNPLVASITEVTTITDEDGVQKISVSGTVKNQSEKIYGVPDLIITSYGEKDNIVARQKFLPSATLLDIGEEVRFTHILSSNPAVVKRVSVELQMQGGKK